MSSPLGISQQYSSNVQVHNPNIPTYNPNNYLNDGDITSNFTSSQSVQAQSKSDFSSVKVVNPLDGSTSFITPKVTVSATHATRSDPLDDEWDSTIANQQLARIILAERDLNLRLEYEERNRNSGRAATRYDIRTWLQLSHRYDVMYFRKYVVFSRFWAWSGSSSLFNIYYPLWSKFFSYVQRFICTARGWGWYRAIRYIGVHHSQYIPMKPRRPSARISKSCLYRLWWPPH